MTVIKTLLYMTLHLWMTRDLAIFIGEDPHKLPLDSERKADE
jgi:hypothetical protein